MVTFLKTLNDDFDLINTASISRITISLRSDNGDFYTLDANTKHRTFYLAAGTLEFCQQKKKELDKALNVVDFTPEEKE